MFNFKFPPPIASSQGHTYLKASEIQYAIKLVTPHFLASLGTGSRSLFVLWHMELALVLHSKPYHTTTRPSAHTPPNGQSSNSPSFIPLSKRRLGLINLGMRTLEVRHCRAETLVRGCQRRKMGGKAAFLSTKPDDGSRHALYPPLG